MLMRLKHMMFFRPVTSAPVCLWLLQWESSSLAPDSSLQTKALCRTDSVALSLNNVVLTYEPKASDSAWIGRLEIKYTSRCTIIESCTSSAPINSLHSPQTFLVVKRHLVKKRARNSVSILWWFTPRLNPPTTNLTMLKSLEFEMWVMIYKILKFRLE